MAGSSARLSPEFALVEAVETVPALRGKVSALQPPNKAAPPLAFYVPTADSEDEDFDGPTQLQHFTGTLHFVAKSAGQLFALCSLTKRAVAEMTGSVYSTTEEGDPRGRILVERTRMEQSSPDLYENEVGLFRRMYTVQLDYQTEEVCDEEVISG